MHRLPKGNDSPLPASSEYGRSEKTDQVINVLAVRPREGGWEDVAGGEGGEGTPKDIPVIEAEVIEAGDSE